MTTQPSLTPAAFAAKWHGVATTEKASAQEHFIDLCRMLGEPTPHEADPICRLPSRQPLSATVKTIIPVGTATKSRGETPPTKTANATATLTVVMSLRHLTRRCETPMLPTSAQPRAGTRDESQPCRTARSRRSRARALC